MFVGTVSTALVFASFIPRISFYAPDGTVLYELRDCQAAGDGKWSVDLASQVSGEHLISVIRPDGSVAMSRVIDVQDLAGSNLEDIFDTSQWASLLAKVGGAQVSIDVETQSLAIDGLTEQDITIVQGADWDLDVEVDIPAGAAVEFLLRDESSYGPAITGGAIRTSTGVVLSLDSSVTSDMDQSRYKYNVFWSLGEDREQVLRGTATVQKSVLDA